MKRNRTFENSKNIKQAIRLLSIVTSELDRRDIAYYLDFGTLIGAMRSGSLIPWDHDIDISLKNEKDYHQIPDVLAYIAKKYRYRTYIYTFQEMADKRAKRGKTTKKMIPPFAKMTDYQIAKVRTNKFLFFGKGHICLDIFFKYNHKAHSYWYAYGRVNRTTKEALGDKLIPFTFYGHTFKIPENYDAYLTEVYGDWRVEKRDWTNENGSRSAEELEQILTNKDNL